MGGFHPFEVTAAHLAYTILGGFVVIFGLFSLAIKERLYIGEAVVSTIVGIIIGPYVTGLVDPYKWGGGHLEVTDEITLEITRVVIAIGVFAVGVELPKAYVKKHWRSLFFLLGPAMVWGWLISALLMWAMVPGLTYLSALVIAACVTPTDPILAQAVVGGKFANKHVPAHIRHLLSAESGSNDGAAFPFLYIALYLTLDKSAGHAVGEWFYVTWVYEVLLGILIGATLGFTARKVMKFSERKKLIDRQSYVAQYVSLAVLSIGICTLLGSDDLLAAFACGTAFAWDGFFNKATEDALFSNVIDLLFNCAAFIYIGALIPFEDFQSSENHLTVWRLVVLTLLILILRRMPAILALYRWIPDIKTFREALFVGWFGPMGVGAIFISTLARSKIPEPEPDGDTSQVDLLQSTIGPIVAFLVLSSVLTHGLSIPFFLSGRRVHSITYTWSRNPSISAGDEPAWTTHANRITPGQQIIVNRDHEDGDLGLQNNLEKQREDSSNGSSSSRTRAELGTSGEESMEMEAPKRNGSPTQYREGHDLIIEHPSRDGNEPHVQVIQDAFPREVGEHGLQGLGARFARHMSDHSSTSDASAPALHISQDAEDARSPAADDDDHSTNAGSDDEDVGDGFVRRRPYSGGQRSQSPPPESRTGTGVHSFIPANRLQGNKQKADGGWRRFLRVGTTSSNASGASAAEEGRAHTTQAETGFLRVGTNRSMMRSTTIDPTDDPHDRGLHLTRTLSRAISFAPETAKSSETAPTMGNYGSVNSPGFKPNQSLAMFRTTSVQSNGDGPSVSFQEPKK